MTNRRRCLYRCPKCGATDVCMMMDLDRIVTCPACVDEHGYPSDMELDTVEYSPEEIGED